MARKVAVHHYGSAGSVHAEERRPRSASFYGRKGGPRRQAWRLWDAFLLKQTGQQGELLLGETSVLERILTYGHLTIILTLNANCEPLLLRSSLRSASKGPRSFRLDQAVLRVRSCNVQTSRWSALRTRGLHANPSETSHATEKRSAWPLQKHRLVRRNRPRSQLSLSQDSLPKASIVPRARWFGMRPEHRVIWRSGP